MTRSDMAKAQKDLNDNTIQLAEQIMRQREETGGEQTIQYLQAIQINPYGIPMYYGKTMEEYQGVYIDVSGYKQTKYGNAALTMMEVGKAGNSYKYIHPKYFNGIDYQSLREFGYKEEYHGEVKVSSVIPGETQTLVVADNRIQIAVLPGIYAAAGASETSDAVGTYIDIYLSEGTVIPCILGDAKEPSDAGTNGIVHHDGSMVEFLVAGEIRINGVLNNVDKNAILHGEDIVGFYVYEGKNLYKPIDAENGKYHYYFNEVLEGEEK